MKAWEIIGYTADASIFCPICFTKKIYGSEEVDSDGNEVYPIFASDEVYPIFASDSVDGEVCSECGGEIE